MENKIKLEDTYKPGKFELDTIQEIYKKYYTWRNYHFLPRRQFRGLSLLEYLAQSRDIFYMNSGNSPDDDEKKQKTDFEIYVGEARRASLEILSTITSLKIKPKNLPNFNNNLIYWQKFLDAIYQKWRVNSIDKIEKFWQLLYATVNGTVVINTSFDYGKKKVKNIKGFDPETGEFDIEELDIKKINDVVTRIVPLENVFIPKIWERNIQKQEELIISDILTLDDFKRKYANYPNSKYVHTGNQLMADSLFLKLLGGDQTMLEKVVVLSYYNEPEDRFDIVANGVYLNPISYKREPTHSPIPFNHKKLPFISSIFEPIDEKFFYGLSLPFKLKDPDAFLNSMMELLLEREMKEVSPPILSEDIEKKDIKFGANQIIPVTDINAYKELTINPASPQFFSTLNYLSGIVQAQTGRTLLPESSSIQPKTATERRIQEQIRFQVLSSTVLMLWYLIRQEYELVVKTALQFYSYDKLSKSVDERVIKTLNLSGINLTRGGIGNLIIRIVKSVAPPDIIFGEEENLSKVSGQTQIIEVSADALKELDFIIEDIILEQEDSNELKQALFQEKTSFMLQAFGQIIDPFKAFARYLEVIGESPSDWAKDELVPQVFSRIKDVSLPPLQPPTQNNPLGMAMNSTGVGGQSGSALNNLLSQLRGQINGAAGGLTTAQTNETGQEPQLM
jgi:hypothetical protein